MHPRDLCKALQALDVWVPARVRHHLYVTFFAIRLRRSVDHLSGCLQYNLASFVTINIIKDVRRPTRWSAGIDTSSLKRIIISLVYNPLTTDGFNHERLHWHVPTSLSSHSSVR